MDVLEAQYPGFKATFGNNNPILLQLTEGDPTSVSIHWSGKLEGLPVAYKVDDGMGGTAVHYLQYVVVERVPEGYKLVEYQLLEDTASVVILNELNSVVLPGTGGFGYTYYYVLAGVPLFLGIALLYIEKKRRKEVQNE